jgi:hypothetical protein
LSVITLMVLRSLARSGVVGVRARQGGRNRVVDAKAVEVADECPV